MPATEIPLDCSPAPQCPRSAWLECGAARFEVQICELAPGSCELLVDSCCCGRLREGSAVTVELPPPVSGAGLLRLSGHVTRRSAGPEPSLLSLERLCVAFASQGSAPLQALAAALAPPACAAEPPFERAA